MRRSYAGLLVGMFGLYMAFAVVVYLWLGITFTPDLWLVALFIGAVVFGRAVAFLRDWIPFVFLIFGYEFLRGVAGNLVLEGGFSRERHGRIQVESLIDADRWLFGGTVPTLWLQERFFAPGQVQWYDVMSVVLYALHFPLPLVFAFILWIKAKERFWQFSLSFLAMTYAAFAVFLLFPAAPPWLAHRWGYLDGVQYPSTQAFQWLLPRQYDGIDTFRLWTQASPNPVAAMPSLHAAFPWLVLLFAVTVFGRRGWAMLVYNAVLWFAVVYLAQHWVIDVIAGIAWATLWYGIVLLAWSRIERGPTLPASAWLREPRRRAQAVLPIPFQRSPDRS